MSSYVALSAVDAVQSANWDGYDKGNRIYEINPFFANDDGTANMGKLITWKIVGGLGAYFIVDRYPKIRRPLLIGINVLQGGVVIYNGFQY